MDRRGLLLIGVVLALVGPGVGLGGYLVVGAWWVLLTGSCLGIGGLITVAQVLLPERSSFRAGTEVWQNDGLPGGGA